jgi:hypothetical protein
MPHLSRRAAALSILSAGLMPKALRAARPAYVDLSRYQTPLKNQGGRNTCITFAALAALEAACNRAGYGELALSEEFLNHFGKMTWLTAPWSKIVAKGEDGQESQVGAFGGGQAASYIEALANGMRVPVEAAMPYHAAEFTAKDHPHLANAWDSPFWTQRRTSDFNLDRKFLPLSALTQQHYYAVKRFSRINPKDPNALEDALASGKEVAWDIDVANTGDVWTVCRAGQAKCPNSAHAVLLIGYDRRDSDPGKHFFMVKNSWGPPKWPGGFTRISYDYVRKYGLEAATIDEIEPPRPWPELAFIGRWNLNFDGHKGVLDIYHIPGIAQINLNRDGGHVQDNRLGAFYDDSGKAYRVNGHIFPDRIEFHIDFAKRNLPWNELSGRKFVYSRPVNQSMAGFHTDPDGLVYAGFATQASFPDGARTPRPFDAKALLGPWNATFLDTGNGPGSGTLQFERGADALRWRKRAIDRRKQGIPGTGIGRQDAAEPNCAASQGPGPQQSQLRSFRNAPEPRQRHHGRQRSHRWQRLRIHPGTGKARHALSPSRTGAAEDGAAVPHHAPLHAGYFFASFTRRASRAFRNGIARSRIVSTMAIFSANGSFARSFRASALRARMSETSG